jgi:organic hydroperoxide reductase OsmC/OhrA
MKEHSYKVNMRWTGNDGQGTQTYRAYRRDHVIRTEGKPEIAGSSDPSFRGDPARYNPEELLVAALSSCHMLSYLHMCAVNGVVVTAYEDTASGTMQERPDGSGVFTRVVLHPRVTITAASDPARARALHHDAHEKCFIANSVNFPVDQEPEIVVAK